MKKMSSGKPSESRQTIRYEADEAVEFRAWPVKGGKEEKVLGYGRLLDISDAGVRFTYSGRIKKGQTVRLRTLQPEDSVLQFDPVVAVKWVQGGSEDEMLVGGECCATSQRRFSPFA